MERATDLGDRTIRLPVERNDELGRLSENFNHLMDSLEPPVCPLSPHTTLLTPSQSRRPSFA